MPRFYMILVRSYTTTCECEHKNPHSSTCTHAPDVPLDKWDPYSNNGGVALYHNPPRTQSIRYATVGHRYWAGAEEADPYWNGQKRRKYVQGPRRGHRVVYFDTESLLDLTQDYQLAYEQAEAAIELAADRAEAARVMAANPPPAPEPATKKKRKSRKKPEVLTGIKIDQMIIDDPIVMTPGGLDDGKDP